MPTDVRKQRLLREAHEIEGADSANAGNDFALIVVAVLVLAIYWGAAAIVAGSAMNRQGDASPQIFATQKMLQSPGNAAAQSGTQNRTAHDTNREIYTDRGSR